MTSESARSALRSTSLTKSAGPLVSQRTAWRCAAALRITSAARTAAATHVANNARASASTFFAVACPVFSALLASRDVTDFQRDSALGRAAPRQLPRGGEELGAARPRDRKSTRLNSSHRTISYAVF